MRKIFIGFAPLVITLVLSGCGNETFNSGSSELASSPNDKCFDGHYREYYTEHCENVRKAKKIREGSYNPRSDASSPCSNYGFAQRHPGYCSMPQKQDTVAERVAARFKQIDREIENARVRERRAIRELSYTGNDLFESRRKSGIQRELNSARYDIRQLQSEKSRLINEN